MNFIRLSKSEDLATYEPSAGLKAAAEMAHSVGRPLLLSGKPGTGKTQFAHWYAKSLGNDYNPEPFVFSTKSTSVFTDLFYYYDAVSHFRTKEGDSSAERFVELTALGKAIVAAAGPDALPEKIIPIAKKCIDKISRPKSVVLIDEVDKAPRDFPNDLLHEIDNMSFLIKEISPDPVSLPDLKKRDIAVILTSNFEKNLPDAFLRRCVFYHIEFPDRDQMKQILVKKLKLPDNNTGLQEKIDLFFRIYNKQGLQKQPSTSECIDWVNWLNKNELLHKPASEIKNSVSILLKNEADMRLVSSLFTS